MAAAIGVRGRFKLLPCSGPGWLISLSALLSVVARGALATTHWVVTEDGKIQQQVAARVLPSLPAPREGIPEPGPCVAPRGPAPSLASHGPGPRAEASSAQTWHLPLPLPSGPLALAPPWGTSQPSTVGPRASRNRPWGTET